MAKRKGSTFGRARKRRTTKRPWLTVAAICERALIEKDHTPSVIRIFDTITVESDAPQMPAGLAKPTLFLMFRGGPAVGWKTLAIRGLSPSGKELFNHESEIEFLGDEHAAIVDSQMQVPVSEAGLYWFEIRLDGNLETRVPLQVRYRQTTGSTAGPKPPAQD